MTHSQPIPTLLFRPTPIAMFAKSRRLFVWASIAVLHTPVQATVDIALKLDTQFGYNSNLFRSSADVEANASGPTPQTAPVPSALRSQSVDAAVGIPMGSDVTKLVLTTSLGNADFAARPELNHNPYNITAALPWRLTDLWSGSIAAGNSRLAYAYDDLYPRLDIVESTWMQFALKLQVTPSVSFPVQVAQQTVKHQDVEVHGFLDSEQKRVSTSVMYASGTGSTAQWGIARSETRYPRRSPVGSEGTFRDRDSDVFFDVLWAYSPQTQFSIWWANRERTTSSPADNSRRLNLYRFGVSHSMSPLLRVDAQLWRQPVSTTETGFPNDQSSGQRIGLTYTPNPKWEVSAVWLKDKQQNQLGGNSIAGSLQDQSNQNVSVRATYQLGRGLALFADATADRRARGQGRDASQKVVKAGVEYRFENVPGAEQRTRPSTAPLF